MVDFMCSFDFRVLCFALHLFFPTNLCLARLGHWLGLLHVPLPFLALALSSISSSSCCRDAQLLGICQSEIWSHMFLESLTLEFVSIWAPLTFSIGKLQKLALAVWAWNFVSFRSIFCSNHSGTLFSLGVWTGSWRKSVWSLASSSLHCALELQTSTAQAISANQRPKSSQQVGPMQPTNAAATGSSAKSSGTTVVFRWDNYHFITPVARQFWQRRKCVRTLASPKGDLQNSALSRSFVIEKVCMYSI